jgi:hypothetical protein
MARANNDNANNNIQTKEKKTKMKDKQTFKIIPTRTTKNFKKSAKRFEQQNIY